MQRTTMIGACLCSLLAACAVTADDTTNEVADRGPHDFAIIFNMGYAGDHFPKDKDAFQKLIQSCKQANYSVVLCKYEKWREEICRKHGVKMLVDLLTPEHHVYKNVEGAKTLCESLRGNDAVWGYHLWSDRIGGTAAGRSRDIANVQSWDSTHAAYVGSYKGSALESLVEPDAVGYYDFHWFRGGHWRHLLRAHAAAKKTDAALLRYCQGDPGKVGVGNYNRVMYTISTSLAFGLKGYLFHYRGGEIDTNTWQWKTLGDDLAKVNAYVAPLGPELMKIGNPQEVYSTPITKTAKDRPTGQDAPTVPAELAAIPDDHWVQVEKGEAVLGVFKNDDATSLFFANHNAYQVQEMSIRFIKPVTSAELFDREQKKWRTLTVTDGVASFQLPAAGGELLRVKR